MESQRVRHHLVTDDNNNRCSQMNTNFIFHILSFLIHCISKGVEYNKPLKRSCLKVVETNYFWHNILDVDSDLKQVTIWYMQSQGSCPSSWFSVLTFFLPYLQNQSWVTSKSVTLLIRAKETGRERTCLFFFFFFFLFLFPFLLLFLESHPGAAHSIFHSCRLGWYFFARPHLQWKLGLLIC